MSTVVPREFLQERLAFFGRAGFLFSTGFLAVFNIGEMLDTRRVWADWVVANRSNQFHAGLCLVFLVVWLACRQGERSTSFLAAVDSGGLWLAALACILPVWWSELSRVHAMFLELTQIILGRAVIVPSTARRTFWLSAAVVPGATLAAGSFHLGHSVDALPATKATLEAALFCSMAVVTATLASRVIYGLRAEVLEARKLGQYTLQEKLGEGGMGIVYRARHAMLRRPTAIKLLPPDRAGENSIRRFEREVQITSQLTHPNTVSVYDYGRTPEGIFYYAMELLDGVTLGQLVVEDGPQPPARVVHILRQVCAALGEAHALGLVHRDIKPANVILCERWNAADVVKVVDFGLVKDLSRQFDSVESASNMVAGTPQYISPEAVRTPDQIGPSADIYAVGAVGYYMLTGRAVFEGNSIVDVLSQHLERRPVPPSERLGREVPPRLEAVILACLEKEPSRRPANVEALAGALASCLDTVTWTHADAQSWWERRRTRPASHESSAPPGITDQPTLARTERPSRSASRPPS